MIVLIAVVVLGGAIYFLATLNKIIEISEEEKERW